MSENRLMPILPQLEGVEVLTAWDMGWTDATAIWWFQSLKNEIRVLDYFEDYGQPIAHYCDVVKSRGEEHGYRYGKHYVPHDAANELQAAGGRSIVQQADALGVRMWVVPATSQQNGIEAARKTLERTWFDASRCEQGLEALRQYQFEFDAERKVYRDKPRHDWASHGADAFEIIAQVWRKPEEIKPPSKPRFLHEITFQELIDSTPSRQSKRI
jgi:hypothetical protein